MRGRINLFILIGLGWATSYNDLYGTAGLSYGKYKSGEFYRLM
jgi:hypothetical protein